MLAEFLVNERDHYALEHVVKPTLGNLLLWRSVYRTNERIYVDAVRMGLLGEPQLIAGNSVPLFSIEDSLPALKANSLMYGDWGKNRIYINSSIGDNNGRDSFTAVRRN